MALQPEAIAYHTDNENSSYFFNNATGTNNGVASFNDSNIYFLSTSAIEIPLNYSFQPGKTYNINSQVYTYQYGDNTPGSNADLVTTLQATGTSLGSSGVRRNQILVGYHNYSGSPFYFVNDAVIQNGASTIMNLSVASPNGLSGATLAVQITNTTVQRLN